MTTPSSKTRTSSPDPSITRDPQTEKGQINPHLVSSPTRDETTPAISPTTPVSIKQVTNPYSVKKSKIHTENRFTNIKIFLSIVADYISILVSHDETLVDQPWYILWQSWVEEDIPWLIYVR